MLLVVNWDILVLPNQPAIAQAVMQGLGLALDGSGWMMSTVRGLKHVSLPAQTGELSSTTVVILRMWQYIVQ